MSFLNMSDKTFLVTGVANKKSIAYHVAKVLKENGAQCFFSVQSEDHYKKVETLFPEDEIFICDVGNEDEIDNLKIGIRERGIPLDGILHSIAYANYFEGIKPFIETKESDFTEALSISCFSLVTLSNALSEFLNQDSSIVTISISDTKATSYGYMGPIKATLDSTVPFLAKSFSEFSQIRVNAVCAGPLKTSASAGIPGYIDNYLYAEQLTLRKKALTTTEVANTVAFLLSDKSSGINGERIVVDAGMSCNYFDQKIVQTVTSI